jgi:hypothetical protein
MLRGFEFFKLRVSKTQKAKCEMPEVHRVPAACSRRFFLMATKRRKRRKTRRVFFCVVCAFSWRSIGVHGGCKPPARARNVAAAGQGGSLFRDEGDDA